MKYLELANKIIKTSKRKVTKEETKETLKRLSDIYLQEPVKVQEILKKLGQRRKRNGQA